MRAMNRARKRIAAAVGSSPTTNASSRSCARPVALSTRGRRGFACACAAAALCGAFASAAKTRRDWRGGRAVEGARLESVYTGNRIAGSNPAPSASEIIVAKNGDLSMAW